MTEPSPRISACNFRILNLFGSSLTADGPASGGRYDPAEAYSVSLASGNSPSTALRQWGSAIIVACDLPLLHQLDHFPAKSHQPQRGFSAVQVVIDLVPDRILDVQS